MFQKEVPSTFVAKVAASFKDGSIHVWGISSSPSDPHTEIFKVSTKKSMIPKTIRFDQDVPNLFVYSLNGGFVYVITIPLAVCCDAELSSSQLTPRHEDWKDYRRERRRTKIDVRMRSFRTISLY